MLVDALIGIAQENALAQASVRGISSHEQGWFSLPTLARTYAFLHEHH